MKHLTEYEHLLVELVHYLAYGNDLEHGLTPHEIKEWLTKPLRRKEGKNALQCLKEEGNAFLEELREYMSKPIS
jgi:hypothetical protein